jgi:hypothetical protein
MWHNFSYFCPITFLRNDKFEWFYAEHIECIILASNTNLMELQQYNILQALLIFKKNKILIVL